MSICMEGSVNWRAESTYFIVAADFDLEVKLNNGIVHRPVRLDQFLKPYIFHVLLAVLLPLGHGLVLALSAA